MKDDSQRQDTKYTVKHVVDGEEQTDDTKEYTSTAWVNDSPAKIAIVEGSLAEKSYTGYKLGSRSVAEDTKEVNSETVITLTYVKDSFDYTVKYVDEYGKAVAPEKQDTVIFESEITEDAIIIPGYALDESESSKTITISADETKNVITFVYSVDMKSDPDEDSDDNPDNGDGIPDKYQITVGFEVVNGTWNSVGRAQGNDPVSRVLTLKGADGNWSETGAATLIADIVPGSRANRGYEKGKWNVNPVGVVLTKADDGRVFTIRYSAIPDDPTPTPVDPDPTPTPVDPDPTPTPVDPDPTPTPEPTPDPEPAPTPAPAPAAAPAPVAAAPVAPVVAVADAPVPLAGIDLGEEEEGEEPVGIEQVVNIEEEEVPLANEDLHDCCIFHFLEMLLALILLAWYTHDSKKRQKKIFELREQLGTEQTKRGISPQNYSAR